MGAHWQAVDASSNVFRLIFQRKHPTLPCQQPVFYTFPHLDEYSTGDLYEPHPEKPGLWKYIGRGDDIIVFTNGEKLNPVTIQDAIQGHPSIKGALVVGQEKFQPALILEPREPCKTPEDAEQLIEHIWPTVEKVNEVTVAHGRIVRQLVMVSDPKLPFLRTPKGTVQRRLTIAAYQAKIDNLYEEASLGAAQESFALDFQSEAHLARSIIALLEHVLGVDGLYPDTDLFSRGIDSLQVMSFATALRISLPAEKLKALSGPVDHRTVYKYPSAAKLAAHLFKSQDVPHTNGLGMMQDIRTTESFVSKYKENLPPAADSAKPAPSTDDQVVVLTGTTGTLGAHMLHELCLAPKVRKVYALNRGKDGGESRQGSISASRGLCTDFSKVEFLGVDLSLADFGIGTQKLAKLCQSVDRIIHNAWPVNFNWSVESFEPHIRGVRHLVDFSHAATKTVPIIFISSVGTVQSWKSDSAIPEQPFDASVSTMGYGLSKTASSLILDEARMRSGIPTASVRVGQIAGPKGRKGIWNPQEMVPTIIASSVYLGMLPDDPCTGEVIEWMAIEDVSRVILDIAGVTAPVRIDEISGYFHLVNPNKTTWSEIVPALRDYYGDRITNTVSLKKWVEALKASATRLDDIDKNPGIKLLDSIEAFASKEKSDAGFVRLETKRTERLSPTMSRFEKVTPELVKNWCDQWGY
jgi:thioester reductase-like protein/aryl carrier-like protein